MTCRLECGDALNVARSLPDNSVNLIVTDPPYFRVKGEWWDRQWDTAAGFLAWLGEHLDEWQRILAPNGSLYVFASPRMAARVEVEVGKRFEVLNRIRWIKEAGWHNKAQPEALRSFLSPWEEIIFAEHYGADGYAKGEAGYGAKCNELRGFVFEPLRAYLAGERDRAGMTTQDVAEAWRIKTGNDNRTGMAGHWFEQVQWTLPTAPNYQWLRETMARHNNGGEYLRREYEELRRPFSVSADVPYTDVWTFPTVAHYPGKHPCEKPLDMLRHIVSASSRDGDTVADFFMGGGTTALAAQRLGREFIGCDIEQKWVGMTRQKTAQPQAVLL